MFWRQTLDLKLPFLETFFQDEYLPARSRYAASDQLHSAAVPNEDAAKLPWCFTQDAGLPRFLLTAVPHVLVVTSLSFFC